MTGAAEPDVTLGRGAELLREAMRREMAHEGATKRQALRIAVVWAINSGLLPPGARLPSEIDLARRLDVSTGTVQAALGQVQDLGLIERRRGAGTRVLDCSVLPPSIWHFRMYGLASGEAFRILDQRIEILSTDAAGPWSDHLGPRRDYTVIRRRILGTGGVRVGAQMVLDGRLVPAAGLSPGALRQANLRTVLEARLGVAAVQGTRRVSFETLCQRERAVYELPADAPLLRVEARTFLTDQRPFYFQILHAPADQIAVEF